MFSSKLIAHVAPVLSILLLVSVCVGALAAPLDVFAQDPVITQPSVTSAAYEGSLDPFKPEQKVSCDSIDTCLAAAMYWVMYACATLALWASGLLNWVILELLVGMGTLVGNMTGVLEAWEVLRDVANIFLVFLIIWVGVATILSVSSYGYQRLLWKIALAALLVNFSSTITKFVIDVSNLVAIETYIELMTEAEAQGGTDQLGCASTNALNISDTTCLSNGVAAVFWSKLKITTLFDKNVITALQSDTTNNNNFAGKILMIGILGSILFLVLAFVLGAAAFMLIARFVILTFLIIVSPIALVAWITGTGGSGRRWWSMLINQSFVAPLLFLMWYLSLTVIDTVSDNFATGSSNLATTVLAETSNLGMLSFFIIAIGFLVASLILARSMGAYGANTIIRTGASWSKRAGLAVGAGAGAVTAGTIARGGRETVGRAGNAMANSKFTKNLAASDDKGLKGVAKRFSGRAIRGTGDKVGSKSFDARGLSKDAQKYVGTAKKGGYAAVAKERAQKMEAEKKWVGEVAPTSEQTKQRDIEQDANTAKHARVEKYDSMDEEKNVKTRITEIEGELDKFDKEIEKARHAGDTESVQKLEGDRAKVEEKYDAHQAFDTAQARRQQLKLELQKGTDVSGNTLNEDSIAQHQATIAGLDQTIEENYGEVNEDVGSIDKQIQETQEAMQNATEGSKKALGNKLTGMQAERDTMVKLFESQRELYDMGDAWSVDGEAGQGKIAAVQQDIATKSAKMQEFKQSTARNIDTTHGNQWKGEADQRVDSYLSNASTERTLGFVPTPAWKRETAMKLRKLPKDKQLMADFEEMVKKRVKDEEAALAGGAETAAAEATTEETTTTT